MDEENLMKWLSAGDLQVLSRILEDRYGFEAPELRRLPGEFKNSFVVVNPESATFVIKLTDVEGGSGRMHMQTELLEHLAVCAPGLPVPRVVRARDGAHVVTIKIGERQALLMMLTWLPGESVSELSVPSPELLWEIGETAARFVEGLSDFDHPSAAETHEWHILDSATSARSLLPLIVDNGARSDVISVLHWYEEVVLPKLDQLNVGIVHQDLNDFNVLVQRGEDARFHVCGVIDVGDAIQTVRIAEVAIACAYAMLRSDDPVAAACHVIAGYSSVLPLTDAEASCILPLAAARLALNATVWTTRQQAANDSYAESRMRFTWPLLRRLAKIDLGFATSQIRSAAGIEPEPSGPIVATWLAEHRTSLGPLLSTGQPLPYLDLSSDGSDTAEEGYRGHLAPSLSLAARRRTGAFESATLGLGVQVSLSEPRLVFAPLGGTLERIEAENHRLLLRHEPSEGPRFWTQIDGIVPELVPLGSVVQ
jgi:Ser/Thr protein kinase RdoA (MazF antagonist)